MVLGDDFDQLLQIDQEDIEQVDTFQFLGSYIEKKRSQEHIWDQERNNNVKNGNKIPKKQMEEPGYL